MTKFDKIKEIIREYHVNCDKIFSDYKTKEAEAREKYTPAAFRSEFLNETWVKMAGEMWHKEDSTVGKVMEIFDEIEKEFSKWAMRPINSETAQVLDCIRDFDLKLSLQELRIIENNVRDSYFGMRVLGGLAKKNSFSVKMFEADDYFRNLKAARNNVEMAIRAYAGAAPSFQGRDLIHTWVRDGIDLGEYQSWQLLYAANFLEKNQELDRLEAMWNKAKAPIEYTLLPEEVEKVEKSIGKIIDVTGNIDEKAADELIKKDPDFVKKLDSMPDSEHKKSVQNYYDLKGFKEETIEDKSEITPVIKIEGSPLKRLVDATILEQFK